MNATEKYSPYHSEMTSLNPNDATVICGLKSKGAKLTVLSGRE